MILFYLKELVLSTSCTSQYILYLPKNILDRTKTSEGEISLPMRTLITLISKYNQHCTITSAPQESSVNSSLNVGRQICYIRYLASTTTKTFVIPLILKCQNNSLLFKERFQRGLWKWGKAGVHKPQHFLFLATCQLFCLLVAINHNCLVFHVTTLESSGNYQVLK